MHPAVAPQPDPQALPAVQPGLEETAAACPADWPQAAAFALHRAQGAPDKAASDKGAQDKAAQDKAAQGKAFHDKADRRPLLFVSTADWARERGRLSVRGLARMGLDLKGLLCIWADKDLDALWALEEALKSGAVRGAVGTVGQAAFVATRRLDFAARAGRASAVLLRARGGEDLSVARLRWQVSAMASGVDPYDRQAPGPARLHAALTRRRDGPLGAWILEQDDGTHRLRLAAGLADHGLVAGGRTHAFA